MFQQKFKYAPGDLVENNHPCECLLDHTGFHEHEGPTRIFRVKEVLWCDGHESLVLKGFREESCWCSGTFRPVKPSTESIDEMIKANQPVKEPVHG